MKATEVYGILKISQKEFMESFLTKGHIYMNTLRHFKELEKKDKIRGDKSEGLAASFPAEGMKIKIGGHEIKGLKDQVTFGHPEDEETVIFSMHAITNLNLNKDCVIDNRMHEFGEYFVIIINPDEFQNRIKKACEKNNWKYQFDLVEYVNKSTHNGDMGPFRKYSDLSHQSEYRLAIKTGNKGALDNFYIGDISDIAAMHEIKHAKSLIKIEQENGASLPQNP